MSVHPEGVGSARDTRVVDTESRQTHSNALARAHDRQNDQNPRNPGQAGLIGAADRSNRSKQGVAGNLE